MEKQTEFKPGQRVTYKPKNEPGIIKSLQPGNCAFVVYHCAGDWKNYQNYTGQITSLSSLAAGWPKISI